MVDRGRAYREVLSDLDVRERAGEGEVQAQVALDGGDEESQLLRLGAMIADERGVTADAMLRT
jgi:hypothetical protein